MRLVGYVRVSTDQQAERGFGLEVQEQAIRGWARANGHRIVAMHVDAGVSGAIAAVDRPGLAAALEDVRAGRAGGVVIAKLDRLARRLTVQEAALAHVWLHGGGVFTADAGEVRQDDPDDPMRTALRQMMGVFAQLERGMITARMRAGRAAKASAGGYAGGRPPYGYSAERGRLVSDPAEQATLRRIRALHRKGESLREIAAALNAEGTLGRSGRPWHHDTLRKILDRDPRHRER